MPPTPLYEKSRKGYMQPIEPPTLDADWLDDLPGPTRLWELR